MTSISNAERGNMPGLTKEQRIRYVLKPAVFVACLGPLAWIVWRGFSGDLGPNPVEAVNRYLGDWALRFLLIALAVSPLVGLTKWTIIARFRRMLGLYAFFYVTLHVTNYIAVDLALDMAAFWKDLLKRTYITLGMTAFVLLTPLAITSTNGMIKRLGAKRWKALHRLVYPAAVLGCIHFYMMVKADHREPLIYGAILAALLGWRLWDRWGWWKKPTAKGGRAKALRQASHDQAT